MELIKECSAISCFPLEASFSCFFHVQKEYCCLASSEKRLYKCSGQEIEVLELARKYSKLLYYDDSSEYLAYTYVKQKHEVIVYHLDQQLREFDVQNLRTDGDAGVEDMWMDEEQQMLYLVFPLSILKYNLNGDFLGYVMKAPANTCYKAVCSKGDTLFVAYERLGCTYVAKYDRHGRYKDKLSIGDSFFVGNMELVCLEEDALLKLYGKRQDNIVVCLELAIEKRSCEEKEDCSEKNHEKEMHKEEKNEICVELLKGTGIGETTCHFSRPAE